MVGDQNRKWYEGVKQFTSPASRYQLVFEGVRGKDYRSDIALDDINLSTGACWDFSSKNSEK